MAIFASDYGISVLEKARVIYVDGTFSKAPAPFCQLFVVMAELGCATRATIPVVYGLLPNKKTETYTKFFEQVARLSENMFKGNLIY
ncbi:MAG: transposase [Sphingomonadales bacterium]|nr:transposase [Sphingomonadales bacterium]